MEIRTFQINEDWENSSWGKQGWFEASIKAFAEDAPSTNMADYDYIQIIPLANYRRFYYGNDGAQAFRHRMTGYTFPDHCRQQDGCPEMWNRTKKHNVEIRQDSPIWDYILEY